MSYSFVIRLLFSGPILCPDIYPHVCPAVMSIICHDMSSICHDMSSICLRIVFCLVKKSVYNSKRSGNRILEEYNVD